MKKFDIVVGLFYGDEGKGATVSHLVEESKAHPVVVRFNGGAQAGHTVEYNGVRHTFSHFGAGTLQGAPTYWSKYALTDPLLFQKEWLDLESKGVKPIFMVDPLSPVVTPFDVMWGRRYAKTGDSCGAGIGSTMDRIAKSPYRIFAIDLFYPELLREKLRQVSFYYAASSISNLKVVGTTARRSSRDDLEPSMNEWLDAAEFFADKTFIEYERSLQNYGHIIFEGAQGVLLDQEYGVFPDVTYSHTTSRNALSLLEEANLLKKSNLVNILHVRRPYITKHGKGYFPGEDSDFKSILINIENEHNQYNDFQGEFRYAPFSLELYELAKHYEFANSEKVSPFYTDVITCIDQIETPNFDLLEVSMCNDRKYLVHSKVVR